MILDKAHIESSAEIQRELCKQNCHKDTIYGLIHCVTCIEMQNGVKAMTLLLKIREWHDSQCASIKDLVNNKEKYPDRQAALRVAFSIQQIVDDLGRILYEAEHQELGGI